MTKFVASSDHENMCVEKGSDKVSIVVTFETIFLGIKLEENIPKVH